MSLTRYASVTCFVAALAGCSEAPPPADDPRADPRNAAKVALGSKLYAQHCAVCHGKNLEGQPDWRSRLPNGRLPAPPHDESGHTWHHLDNVLFEITKHGVTWPNAPKGYESDMPGFAGVLSDEAIWAVLAYIKSHWTSRDLLAARREMTQNVKRQ